ncbi:MAG: hypothetical protein QGH90_05560, partial [Candidatus Poseidoniaceae archaeon]|nr:hypothetical protein [Candidatus Poseidoniaceae archaeon]
MSRTSVGLCVFLLVCGVPLSGCLDGLVEPDVDDIEVIDTHGCIDIDAVNFDTNATVDDGSCMLASPEDFVSAWMSTWGLNMFSPLFDDGTSGRDGITDNLTILGVEIRQSVRGDGLRWTDSVRTVLVDPEDGSVVIGVDTRVTDADNNTIYDRLRVVESSNEVAYLNLGDDAVRAADGTFIPAGESRMTYSSNSGISFISEVMKEVKTPDCEDIHGEPGPTGPSTCGVWPACYKPMDGYDCEGNLLIQARSETSGRGEGYYWGAIGPLTEEGYCAASGGSWVNSPDPNDNGWCTYDSVLPNGVVSHLTYSDTGLIKDDVLDGAGITYTQDGEIMSMLFDFEDEGIHISIKIDGNKNLLAVESYESNTGARYGFSYVTVSKPGDNQSADELEKWNAGTGVNWWD